MYSLFFVLTLASLIALLRPVEHRHPYPGLLRACQLLKGGTIQLFTLQERMSQPVELIVVLTQHLCWLLGTSVRKTRRFLRTDVPSSQHRLSRLWLRRSADQGLKTFPTAYQKKSGRLCLCELRTTNPTARLPTTMVSRGKPSAA
jgi:hypothetical protein